MMETLSKLGWLAGSTIIQFTQSDPALLSVDAIVEEQDTNLILGHSPVVMHSIESFSSLVKKMEQQIVEIPGNVIFKLSGKPKRFIAIIYDVEQTPICDEYWIEEALKKILTQCSHDKINTLAMPILGVSYGKLEAKSIMELLQDMLIKNRQAYPKKILIYKNPRE